MFLVSFPLLPHLPIPFYISHLTQGPSTSLCGRNRDEASVLCWTPSLANYSDRGVVRAPGWGELGSRTVTAGGPDDLTRSSLGWGALIYLINSGPQAGNGKRQDIKSVALANLSQGCQPTLSLVLPPLSAVSSGSQPGVPGSRQQGAGGRSGEGQDPRTFAGTINV